MCLRIWSFCASGDMSKCGHCGKHCTGSNVGQWVWVVPPSVVQQVVACREKWVCNNCAIPPPSYPPPALVQRPDNNTNGDMAEKQDPPPPHYPPPPMCDQNHARKKPYELDEQSDDDMDGNNDDTKDEDLVNLIWHDVDACIISVLVLHVL